MLDLPDGTVLYSEIGSQLYVYRPDASPLAVGKPAIKSLTTNSDGTYHLIGTLFNGISEGAAYGDDNQMAGNRPIVRMTNLTNHVVYYCRTFNWSSTGVMTGTNLVTTEYSVPTTVPYGNYSLVVSANGNSSASTNFSYYPRLVISSQPTNQTYPIGMDAHFSVTATGTGTLGYQWKFGGTNLADNSHISGSHGAALSITSARMADSGNYQVVITDIYNTIPSSMANLVLTIPADAAPQFTGFSVTNGYPQMTMTGHAGGNYAIDATTNFTDWINLTNLSNNLGAFSFADAAGVLRGGRMFYRARFIP
jgi:hypothetical protein